MKYTEKGIKKKIEDIHKDLAQEKSIRDLHLKEIERLRIVLRFYEQKLREIKFKNPSSRVES